MHKGDPYLYLMPLKVEEVGIKPKVHVYHEILNDDEIDLIKKDATSSVSHLTKS